MVISLDLEKKQANAYIYLANLIKTKNIFIYQIILHNQQKIQKQIQKITIKKNQ